MTVVYASPSHNRRATTGATSQVLGPLASDVVPVAVTDTGVGTDAVTQRQTLTDTGSGADAVTLAVTLAVTDTGSGVDAATLAVALTLTDAASGADTAAADAEQVQISVSDHGGEAGLYGGDDTYGAGIYGSTVDSATINVLASDTAVGVDSSSLYDGVATQVVVSDSATGTEAIGPIPTAVTDAAAGTEASVIGLRVFEAYGPYGVGTYGSGTYAADASAVDTATAVEIASITPTGDSAQGSDTGTLAGATANTDNGVGSDAATVAVAVPVADTGIVAETIIASATTAVGDLAAAVEAIFVGILGTDEGSGLDGASATESDVIRLYVLSHTSSVSVGPFTGSISVFATGTIESTYGDGRYGFGAYGPSYGVAEESTEILVPAFSGEVIA